MAGGAIVLMTAVLHLTVGLSLRTSDDAEMMAAVSGYDGGRTRPELLFTNVLVGRVLQGLYGLVPAAPWYGLYLHGLQALAVSVIVVSLLALLAGGPRIHAVIAVSSLVLLLPGFIHAIQFTIVSMLLGLAGLLAFLALRARGAPIVRSATMGSVLLLLSLLVRFQGFAAVILVGVALIPAVALRRRRLDLPAALALATLVAVTSAVVIRAELRWWPEQVGVERPLPYLTSQLRTAPEALDATTRSDPVRASAGATAADRWSANDRALASSWLIYPEMITGPAAASTPSQDAPGADDTVPAADGAATIVRVASAATIGLVRPLLDDPIAFAASTGRLMAAPWWLTGVAFLLLVVAPHRRARVATGGFLAFSAVLIGGIGATRLPDRVALPLLLTLALGAAAILGAHEPSRPRPRAGWFAVVVGAILISAGLVQQATSLAAAVEETRWRRERAEAFFVELDTLGVAPTDTVVLWLVDTWWVMEPLGWDQGRAYRDRTVQLAGWQYRLPYRAQQREDLGLSDWITAVADREDVLLVAGPERVEMLTILLRERRGRLCSEADAIGTVRGGRDVLVRTIEEVPCYGQAVLP